MGCPSNSIPVLDTRRCSLLDIYRKSLSGGAVLEDRCEISRELVFLDDQMVLCVVLDQVEVSKSLHEHADPRPRSAHHSRQFFVRDLHLDANAPRIFLAELSGDLQQRLPKALLAINRHEIGDDLLLVGNSHGQILDKAFEERVFGEATKKLGAGNLFQESIFHCGCSLHPGPKPGQAQFSENISRSVDGKHAFFTFGRNHYEFDLPFFNEVHRLAFVPNSVDVIVFADLDGARVPGFVEQ